MEHKDAGEILIRMLSNEKLSAEEKEALNIAIGVLGWTQLAKSRIKAMHEKRNKNKPQ